MGHKVLIGGTAYEVSGGRCLVDGTGYDIKKGRTLVGGTGYDVVFSGPCTVTVTGTGNEVGCYVIVNGKKYYAAYSGDVNSGDVITFGVYGAGGASVRGWVNVNGTEEFTQVQKGTGEYEWTVPNGINAISVVLTYTIDGGRAYGRITITTS
ncbi:MAG: hypothetical protein ACI3W8_06890 [Oscillospiraceae bacterium]